MVHRGASHGGLAGQSPGSQGFVADERHPGKRSTYRLHTERDGAQVVASTAGVSAVPGLAAYSAAKHGLVGLTKSAALEWADRRVRVNAIVTGNVDTPLYRRLLDASPDQPRDQLQAPNATGRVSDPTEIAGLVSYLLSDEAAFITGSAIPIDGGATAQ